jgi:UDPglucose 6-dehydrogenase
MKIGIIGLGFVGNAIKEAFEFSADARLVLVDPKKGYNSTYQDLSNCDGVFICVPSPQGDDGSCDTSILEDVLSKLNAINYQNTVISKCTAPPEVYEQLNQQYPNLIHAPEFLTASNAVADYANGTFAFIGGRVSAHKHEAERIIRLSQTELANVYYCTIGEAAMAKYAINSFLATKVVFMNELYKLSTAANLNYEKIARMITADNRIGNSHMQVPGPDGAFGFGGMCFPKDTAALLKYAQTLNLNMNVIDAAVKKNTLLRLTGT